eukprot:TRINITY_DN16769_c0_g1_i1.p1 TRINITY_DN16769_c0_g1~~TRINITY_DN16769_c0_g1_i1.p1  ORF type:complete len:1276 (+),score=282.23 TRINITY_DN16769_c0_g1_i1:272-3829(+)
MVVFNHLPVEQDTLLRIVLMNLSGLPLGQGEALDLIEKILLRAVANQRIFTDLASRTTITEVVWIRGIFQLTIYHPPEISKEELVASGLSFAWRPWFWKACVTATILACCDSAFVIASEVWNSMGPVRLLMELLISQARTFSSELEAREKQIEALEREKILELENRIALVRSSALGEPLVTIDKTNSFLSNKLLAADPNQPARIPPLSVVDELANLDKQYGFGRMLCYSRNPDFLMDMVRTQGTHMSTQWLSSKVADEPQLLESLPLECLCELLFHSSSNSQLISQLPNLLTVMKALYLESADPNHTAYILNFFLSKLATKSDTDEEKARTSLHMLVKVLEFSEILPAELKEAIEGILSTDGVDSSELKWLPRLPSLKWYSPCKTIVLDLMYNVLLNQSNANFFYQYMKFILDQEPDMASANLKMASVLEHLFLTNQSTASSLLREPLIYIHIVSIFLQWSEGQRDLSPEQLVTLTWGDQKTTLPQSTMNVLLVVLSQDPPTSPDPETQKQIEMLHVMLLSRVCPVAAQDPTGKSNLVSSLPSASVNGVPVFPLGDKQARTLCHTNNPYLMALALASFSTVSRISLLNLFGLPLACVSMILRHADHELSVKTLTPEQVIEFVHNQAGSDFDVNFVVNAIEIYHAQGLTEGSLILDILKRLRNESMTSQGGSVLNECIKGVEEEALHNIRKWSQSKPQVKSESTNDNSPQSLLSSLFLSKGTSVKDHSHFNILYSKLTKIRALDTEEEQQYFFAFTDFLKEIVTSKEGSQFLLEKWKLSVPLCTVVNSIFTEQKLKITSHFDLYVSQFASVITSSPEPRIKSNPLFTILRDFINQHTRGLQRKAAVKKGHTNGSSDTKNASAKSEFLIRSASSEEIISAFSPFDPSTFSSFLLDMASSRSEDLEFFLNKIFAVFKQVHAKDLDDFSQKFVTGIVWTLKRIQDQLTRDTHQEMEVEETSGTSREKKGKLRFFVGILLDWIMHLCSELDNDLLLQLIFYTPAGVSEVSSLGYDTNCDIGKSLLSGLLHKASWASRRKCFDYLLAQLEKNYTNSESQKPEKLNPSNCLDFLTAFLYHPQSWSGFLSAHENSREPPSLHQFSVDQLNQISDLIIDEMNFLERTQRPKGEKGEESNTDDHHSVVLDVRLNFLISCIKQDTQKNLHLAASHISKKKSSLEFQIATRFFRENH